MNLDETQVVVIEELIGALEKARAPVATCPDADRALAECFRRLGTLYASVDTSAHPEVGRRLLAICDDCLQRLGKPGSNDDGIDHALSLLRPIASALRGAGCAA